MRVGPGGMLSAPAVSVPSVRSYRMDPDGPLGVCWHYTGGVGDDSGTYARNLADRIRTYRKGVDRAASWHVLIARDGTVIQSVPLTRGAWHVAPAGEIRGRLRRPNKTLIGVELENAGRLKLSAAGRFYTWPYYHQGTRRFDPRLEVPKARAVRVPGVGFFDGFTEAQVRAARALVAAIARWRPTLGIADFEHGHVDFDPLRKEDPGPVWADVLPGLLLGAFADAFPPGVCDV